MSKITRVQLSDIDMGTLERLATEATPGPWKYIPDSEHDDWQIHNDEFTFVKQDDSGVPISKADGEFIAAANPATVLALLQEIKRLREIEWMYEDLQK